MYKNAQIPVESHWSHQEPGRPHAEQQQSERHQHWEGTYNDNQVMD